MSTMKFDPPYEYTSHWLGALVLLYAIVVIIPLLRYIADVIRSRRGRTTDEVDAGQPTAGTPST